LKAANVNQKKDPIALILPTDEAKLDAFVETGAALAGLTIDPAYREGVKLHLNATGNAAKLVLSCELEDDAEPGPVFRA
jgi:hypothetical protein